jgi:hypothetical protein
MLNMNSNRSLTNAGHQNAVALVQDTRTNAATMTVNPPIVPIVHFKKPVDPHLVILPTVYLTYVKESGARFKGNIVPRHHKKVSASLQIGNVRLLSASALIGPLPHAVPRRHDRMAVAAALANKLGRLVQEYRDNASVPALHTANLKTGRIALNRYHYSAFAKSSRQ